MSERILGIIPARGGSKRLPGKNIRDLCGKPLVAWTIEQAKKSRYLDKIIVSTDDEEIAEISKEYGAEVPFLRPKELAKDDSPTIDTIIHAIEFLGKKGETYDIIVLLQPTSPLRKDDDIDNAIELFLEKHPESVISVFEINDRFYWTLNIKNGYITPFFDKKYLQANIKDLPRLYAPNGAISISSVQELIKSRSFYLNKSLPYFMPAERSIDIDTELDFKIAKILINDVIE